MDIPPVIRNVPLPGEYGEELLKAGTIVVERLRLAGYEALFAGGFVRDFLIGRPVHDIDIATSARPDEVLALFPGSRAFGKSFGVVQVEQDGRFFEVAMFRRDMSYTDGRRPDAVEFSSPPIDAARRDFTVNGLFYDPLGSRVIDYVGGLADLEARLIRAIGEPAARFHEDYLRVMRAVRFASVLAFNIEEQTLAALTDAATGLSGISAERVRDEFIRTLMEAPVPGDALERFRTTGILNVIFPEAVKLVGVEQPPAFHPEGDVYQHTRLMLDNMRERSPDLIWSILLHDIAKPATFGMTTDREGNPKIHFRGHAEKGADMALGILRRFRCSNDQIEAVCTAVRNHMKFISVPEMKSSTLRKWAGSPHFPLELELHRIDCTSSHGKLDHYEMVRGFREKLESEPILPERLLTGEDLIGLGVKPGPRLGRVLQKAYDEQLEGRIRSRDEALAWARRELGADES